MLHHIFDEKRFSDHDIEFVGSIAQHSIDIECGKLKWGKELTQRMRLKEFEMCVRPSTATRPMQL